jgi:site-specific recombinase XerD
MMVNIILPPFNMEQNQIWVLLQKYLQYAQVIRNYTKYTVKSYETTFKLLLRDTEIREPQELTLEKLEEWFFNGRLKRKWNPATFQSYHKHINMFCKWLVTKDILEDNPAEKIEKPKLEHKLPRTLSKDQAKLVLDASYHMQYTYRFERFRNRALIGIMLLAGLRRGEVINLKINDVSLEENKLFINQAKGHKDRIVPINNHLHSILKEYLKDRKRLKKNSIYFFNGVQGNSKISEKCITRLMFKLRKCTKLDFSAHTLRHAFARLMLEGGCDIYTLSKIMGHSKITTTTIYLSCSNQQMNKSIEMHSLN